MGVLDYITNSDSKIFSLINLILYRYIYNNLYDINDKIKDSRIISDSETTSVLFLIRAPALM